MPGSWIERLDDGAERVERAGQWRFRVAATPKTIMSTLGPVTCRRARYRHGVGGPSFVPVDESLGLVNDWLTRPASPSAIDRLVVPPRRGGRRNQGS